MTATLKQLFNLAGRVAIVTGGSRGLGLQIACALGEFGATVALVARKEGELEKALGLLRGQGIAAVAFSADLAEPESAVDVVKRVMDATGQVDVLVHSAGATWGSPAEEYPLAAWDKVMNVNVTGMFAMTQAVANAAFLPRRNGSVIAVASTAALVGHLPNRPGTVAYNTAKGAILSMTRALAAEWGPRNIRVNALAPGFFPSKMTAETLERHGADLVSQTPLGKLGGNTDLMGPALLLASDAGAHITGQVIVVDGGMTIV